jgi:hypothetical protein
MIILLTPLPLPLPLHPLFSHLYLIFCLPPGRAQKEAKKGSCFENVNILKQQDPLFTSRNTIIAASNRRTFRGRHSQSRSCLKTTNSAKALLLSQVSPQLLFGYSECLRPTRVRKELLVLDIQSVAMSKPTWQPCPQACWMPLTCLRPTARKAPPPARTRPLLD